MLLLTTYHLPQTANRENAYHLCSAVKQTFIVLIFLWLAACTRNGETDEEQVVRASACATSTADGDIVECSPDGDEIRKLRDLHQQFSRINSTNPGPKMPPLSSLSSVEQVSPDGEILLSNGLRLKLAGLECSHPDLPRFLKASFLGQDASKLAFFETSRTEGLLYAYIWEVYGQSGEPTNEDDILLGPTISNMNEMAITSSWCKPVEQEGHEYHDRYLMLDSIGR